MATFNIPNTQINPGEQSFGPFAAPAGLHFVTFSFDPTLLANTSGSFTFLSDMWIDVSQDNGSNWTTPFGTGIFSDPTFIDSKTGFTVASSRFGVIPSPCLLRIRTISDAGYVLTGASVTVS